MKKPVPSKALKASKRRHKILDHATIMSPLQGLECVCDYHSHGTAPHVIIFRPFGAKIEPLQLSVGLTAITLQRKTFIWWLRICIYC